MAGGGGGGSSIQRDSVINILWISEKRGKDRWFLRICFIYLFILNVASWANVWKKKDLFFLRIV